MSQIMKANTQELIVKEMGLSQERVDLIKRTVAEGATNDELFIFLNQAKKMGLDPLARQIYFQKYKDNKGGKDRMTILVGIDGYRSIANQTGLYAGNDDAIFDDEQNPSKATVTVYKMLSGVRCPFTATARWDHYFPSSVNKQFQWKKMPHVMLAKCAEALALRKAFPAELSGAYTENEMDQAATQAVETPSVQFLPTTPGVSVHPKTGEVISHETKVKNLISAFSLLNIWKDDLERWIGKPFDQLDDVDLQKLRGYYLEKKGERKKDAV